MWAHYEHYANMFGRIGALNHGESLRYFLVDVPHLSARDTVYSKGPIIVAEVIVVQGDWSGKKSA